MSSGRSELTRLRAKEARCSEGCEHYGPNQGRVIKAEQKRRSAHPGARFLSALWRSVPALDESCTQHLDHIESLTPFSSANSSGFFQEEEEEEGGSLSTFIFSIFLSRTLSSNSRPHHQPPRPPFLGAFVHVSRLQPPFLLGSMEKEQAC